MSDEQTVEIRCHETVAIVVINRPPVNAIDGSIRRGVKEAIGVLENDATINIIVIACLGKTFLSGADMAEFEEGFSEPSYRETLASIETCRKPVVASMHGTVLGGGLELAMACHWRIAVDGTHFSMPEITLGVIPGAGGTQRLPRLVGAKTALTMLMSAASLSTEKALKAGLIDTVAVGDPIEIGVEFAQTLIREGRGVRSTGERDANLGTLTSVEADEIVKVHEKQLKGRTTQRFLIEAVMAAVEKPFADGLDIEDRLSMAALNTRESAALRHAFFAERTCGKVPASQDSAKPAAIKSVAVIGAGTMGAGIAMSFLNAGFSVTLVDSKSDGLERGMGLIDSVYKTALKKGRISAEGVDEILSRLKPTIEISGAANAGLVVEAVYEDMALKKAVIRQLDQIVSDHAIIASNTSSLSITQIAAAAQRPERIIGLHFFSPAHVMRLVELIRGEKSSESTLITGLEIIRKIKKTGVVAGDAFGFIGNKMMLDGYFREAEQLLLEGATPAQIDRVIEAFGFPMGPFRVNDMGGIDIGAAVREQLYLRESRKDPYCVVSDQLAELGRLGQKSGKGFYLYVESDRQGREDPEVEAIIEQLAAARGIRRRQIPDSEIEERCLLQLINVGATILSEGVAYRASDIDVVWLSGYGFPRYLGGPMFYADTLGLGHVADRIRYYHEQHGHYWKPAPLIQQLAAEGGSFVAYDKSMRDR